MAQKIGAALLEHAETIWKTADTLRGAGIKESTWPSYMMPFFALMLLESRLRRFRTEKVSEFEAAAGTKFDPTNSDHIDWLDESCKAANKGYHPELVRDGKGLKETCLVPGGNFFNRLRTHLSLYDPDTRRLLGLGYTPGTPKYLDIEGIASDLFSRPNSPLFAFAQKWAVIDLTPFNNSEVTTIEEHIKRKWADISAETAGEQYTPSDVIDLATAIIIELRKEGSSAKGIADVYDMACGGGNFVFAAEDALREAFPELSVRSRGQELNDALYALAAIEARFRLDAKIEWGNTLTDDKFLSDKFDVIVANPPYGLDWKDIKTTIESDASGRFVASRLPTTEDGQLLFLQHAAWHLSETGVAAVVHSGSTLFSGDAGSGESETRRWLIQEQDIVEAIIQLPKNEFFNTGISTYVWILNRAKPQDRKGKVLLINAESNFTKLKKNLNQKNCEVDEENRKIIVETFRGYVDGPISRVLPIDALLYNKVEASLHRHDEQGRAIYEEAKIESNSIVVRLDDELFSIDHGVLNTSQFADMEPKQAASAFNQIAKRAERTSVAIHGGLSYQRDNETGRIWIDNGVGIEEKGLGSLTIKAKVGKSNGDEAVKVAMTLGPLWEKDNETITYSSDPIENEALIVEFLTCWVHEPLGILGKKVGSEINFNRVFPNKSELPSTKDILKAIASIEAQMASLEAEIAADLKRGNES